MSILPYIVNLAHRYRKAYHAPGLYFLFPMRSNYGIHC